MRGTHILLPALEPQVSTALAKWVQMSSRHLSTPDRDCGTAMGEITLTRCKIDHKARVGCGSVNIISLLYMLKFDYS